MNSNDNTNDTDHSLDILLKQVDEVLNEIETTHTHTKETLSHVDARVTVTAQHIDSLLIELTTTEAECEDSLDALILEESEAIAQEEQE